MNEIKSGPCPHCNRTFEVPDALVRNAECYGGRSSHVRCRRCGKTVLVRSAVRVVVEVLGKGDNDEVEAW